ncbi:flagellar filament capping protein FliD [Vibrio sp. ZSDE26]|uniref:Flagellar hook-associated protein 2 n=1 Tax=Vibrio amylolyticus TaxID=2847292 RepID=A0A9X2BGY1_9VIBR|nr:flagellar filament capping protein FliD [Vibrio amylolyticus]MCK6263346.1 flagellar filament capping protein FliD [Vibrio amylolyticus]
MIDPAQMAMQMVMIQRQPFDIQYANQQAKYQTQLDAWKEIDTAFSSFQSALDDMNKADNSFVKKSGSTNQDGYINATVGSQAREGSYDLFVKQLAKSQQDSFTFANGEIPAEGTMTLTTADGEKIDIDFADYADLNELTDHINGLDVGINASVVSSGGEKHLVLGSDETGVENKFEVEITGTAHNHRELSAAADAIVMLGGEDGLELTSSTNTFNNAIYGVSFEVTKVHEPGEAPLTLVVGTDNEASKEAVEEFVDAYNDLMKVILKHTKTDYQIDQDDNDDDDDDSSSSVTTAGALAGDSTARGLKSALNNATRGVFDEGTLYSIGIEANRDGTLKIDSDRFEKALAEEPEKIDAIFFGDNGALATLDRVIEPYTGSSSSNSNLLKTRQDTLQGNIDRVEDKKETLDYRMEKTYDRYLREYSAMAQAMAQMQSTAGMFMF